MTEGLIGTTVAATGLALTMFMRRPEYRATTGQPVDMGAGDYGESDSSKKSAVSPIHLIESLGRLIIHYPSHILIFALVNRMDLFLHVYLAMHAAHMLRSAMSMTRSTSWQPPR